MKTELSLEARFREALVLFMDDRISEAEAAYEAILLVRPDHPEPLRRLGLIAHRTGRDDQAMALISRAAGFDPDNPVYYNDLGRILKEQGKIIQAIACYKKALSVRPDDAGVCNNLGNAFQKIGKTEEASHWYRKSIFFNPGLAEAHNNLGNLYMALGLPDASISSYGEALKIRPDYAHAWNNLATILKETGKIEEGVICYRNALRIEPEFPQAWNNLGTALQDQGKTEEGRSCYRKALSMKPDYAQAHSNLVYSLHYDPSASMESLREEATSWWIAHGLPKAVILSNPASPSPSPKLRIGYVSPDFRHHSVSYFFLPILEAQDRSRFEIYCYAEVVRPDEVTARIKSLADAWRSTVGMPDEVLAEQIRKDGIHVLVDLAGHTMGNRLGVFARRSAPVQVTWLGFPGTTGLPVMDFRITDPIADPPGEDEAFHSEILMRLPAGFLCYRPLDAAPEVAPSPACDTGVITFGSFNTLPKLNERVASIWSEILGKVPGSRLLLKTKQLADPGARNYVFSLFRRFGIHEERITLLPRTPDSRDHLSCYNQVDIGLDPFPYNGTTTTCEALWMGVPVVTLRGSRHAARVGASLLSGMRLTKLVAENEKNYVATAVDLASDIKRLAGIRADLRGLMAASPLCNAGAFARNMEEAFHNIWAIHSVNKETSDETVRAPYTISLPENFEKIPEERWASLLSPPECFHKSGEAETYARFVGRLTTGLHRNLSKKPDSPYWRRASRIFLEKANFIPLYFSRLSLTDIYRQRSEIAQTVLSRSGYRLQPSSLHRRSEGKIRLGVHFRGIRPGTEAYAAFPIFANLDRDRFEVYLYVHHTDGNSLEKEAWKLADQFRILPESLNASVQLIREDRLDLLFFSGNTTAVTNESFILSCHRMARFQGVHFASPTTTGHSTVDFFLLGRDVASGCRPGSFTERVLEVEGSGICFHPEVLLPRARGEGVRERLGIPASAKLYVSGANFYKILPELREAWAELISQVPGSLMVLYPFGPSWSAHYPRDAFVSDLRKTFSKKEVSPDRLIVLDSFARREEIAELLAASNVYLDAIPYSGATSLLDPLSQNLPLVVCEGNELRFRQGGAMLRQLEIPELVVPDRESYLRLAAELGRDPALQDYFREKIRSRMNNTPLFLDMTAYGKFVGETLSALVQANG